MYIIRQRTNGGYLQDDNTFGCISTSKVFSTLQEAKNTVKLLDLSGCVLYIKVRIIYKLKKVHQTKKKTSIVWHDSKDECLSDINYTIITKIRKV